MPGSEKQPADASTLVAGAVVGVLVTLASLLAFAAAADGHFVTRREYQVTLVEINRRLDRIDAAVVPAMHGAR